MVPAKRVERLAKGDEVTWDEPRSMMDHLVKAVLAIGPRLANIHGGSVAVYFGAVERDVFAVALHRQPPRRLQ